MDISPTACCNLIYLHIYLCFMSAVQTNSAHLVVGVLSLRFEIQDCNRVTEFLFTAPLSSVLTPCLDAKERRSNKNN